ncbi:scoloptoxin SSD14-like [Planococcus citri]|uniref:scoloptoxin SSD14-like n=1 Tax=Planococcus citri TaxID=170843 RepID=UPI0031F9AA50
MDFNKLAIYCTLAVAWIFSVTLITISYHDGVMSRRPPPPARVMRSDVTQAKLFGKYPHAAVVTNAEPCSTIAKNILQKGGKAVDALISSILCEGVTMPHTLGIGGGFVMTIYEKSKNKASVIIARETAPAKSTVDMYHGDPHLSVKGGLAIGIPGEIKGYWTAYNKFGGGVPWEDIFRPTISLCQNGIPISKILARMLVKYEDEIQSDQEFRTLFVNRTNGELLEAGDTYKNLKLARTLRIIAENGGDAFYKGDIAEALVKDIQEAGGIITEEDLERYEARVQNSFQTALYNDYTLHTVPAPSSGPILSYLLRIVEGLIPAPTELLNTQRITEAMKHAYGARSRLGDPHFVNISQTMNFITSDLFIEHIRNKIEDTKTWDDPAHYGGDFTEPKDTGTANLAVLAENGDAAVATSTINMEFGSFVLSKRTGVLLNNQMDDFSSPKIVNNYGVTPSKTNFIAPGKIPLSSMCPTIILNQSGDVRLLIGGGGGTKITSSVAITIMRDLLMKENIQQSMNRALFHHQLMPMEWQYYPRIPKDIVEGMEKIGHKVKLMPHNSFVAITGIERRDGFIYPCSDSRRPGEVEGY